MDPNQAGQPPAADQNDSSRAYDGTSTSSSYDSSSADEWGNMCTGAEDEEEVLTPGERERREANAASRAPIREDRDARRRALFAVSYEFIPEGGFDIRQIHERDVRWRRRLRDARVDRGVPDGNEADDEAVRKARRAERRLFRRLVRSGRQRDPGLEPYRLGTQASRRARRDVMRDLRRELRGPDGRYDRQAVEEAGEDARQSEELGRRQDEDFWNNLGRPDGPQQPQQPQPGSTNKRKADDDDQATPDPKRARQNDPAGGGPSSGQHAPNGGQSQGQGPPTSGFSQPGSSQQPSTPGPNSQQPPQNGNNGPTPEQINGASNCGMLPTNGGFGDQQGQPAPSTAPQPPPQGGGAGGAGGGGAPTTEGAETGRGGRRRDRVRAQQLGPGAGGWHRFPILLHGFILDYHTLAQQQGTLLPPAGRRAIEAPIIQRVHNQQNEADINIQRNNSKAAATTDRMEAQIPVGRETYTVDEWPEACNHCLERGLSGCNMERSDHPKECDNCTNYRYDVANHPQSMDHDCRFTPGPGRDDVTAERKKPEGQVVDFLRPLLWQCDHCAIEGRYCDADRLMSVKCTTCASLGRECTVRRSPPLRERDYLRALERGFRIMCRLCVKAGKRCSWADSTLNYGSGRPCPECVPFEADSKCFGACTTFSHLPLTGASGIFTPMPMANILPALDDQGGLLFIHLELRQGNMTGLKEGTKPRYISNGIVRFQDPDDPDYRDDGTRKACEFCYYTVSKCEMGTTDRDAACKVCTFIGVKCIDRENGREMPDGVFARVPRRWWSLPNGTGYAMRNPPWSNKFKRCAHCKVNGGRCDRKRPCEACVVSGAQCDDITWGDGAFVADRHPGDRQNAYYINLGWGPQGVGHPKVLPDPTRMVCGPKGLLEEGISHPNAAKETLRAQRCQQREEFLRVLYGAMYLEPGTGEIPDVFGVDNGYPDPTGEEGWPGSYIRNDREPAASRTRPDWALHPPGIANYPEAGIEGGGPGPGGPPPGPGDDSEDMSDANPAGGQGGDHIFGPANMGGQEPGQGPPPQDQPPADDDEVRGDAQTQGNQAGPPGSGHGAPPAAPPPGMNPFVPVQAQPDPATASPPNAAPPDPPNVFKLGTAFTGVERFMARGYTGDKLEEDSKVKEPAANEREVEPSYPWGMARVEGEAETPRIAALNQMEKPGSNVLRDIPDEPADRENGGKPCKDSRAPGFSHCGVVNKHGKSENLRHEDVFSVCADCDMASKKHVWAKEKEGGGVGITMKEILLMRAYYCADCSEVAANPLHWHRTGHSVYGFDEAARGKFDPSKGGSKPGNGGKLGGWKSEKPLPITGCNCAEKLLGRVLCAHHRLFLAQKMIRQAAMMQEYRFRRYGSKICPTCQDQPGIDSSKAGDVGHARHFWACLVCDGRVASEEREGKRQIMAGPEVARWYGGKVPRNLGDMADFTYPRDAFEEDFAIEERAENSSDDGDGEVVDED